jgi:drug/metabolite transporter (DMT)-like permease
VNAAGVAFGVGAAASWGASDFGGGLASRRAAPLATVVVSQAVAIAVAITTLAVVGERYPGTAAIAWAIGGGTAAFVSLLCFYRGLASGAMGLVAAVSGVVGAGLPVVVGIATGDRLKPTDLAGIALALVAVVLVTRPAGDAGIGRRGLAMALLAGLGAGLFFIAMGRSTAAGGETWWPIATSRTTLLTLALATTVALRQTRATARSASLLMVFVGLTDLAGVVLFVWSQAQGALGIAAVLSCQYPAITTILARIVLDERLAPAHVLGIAVALVGIALIAVPW